MPDFSLFLQHFFGEARASAWHPATAPLTALAPGLMATPCHGSQRMPLKWHHITAATEFNMRALRNDRLFSGFLIGSGASLAVLLTAQIARPCLLAAGPKCAAARPLLPGRRIEVETPYGRGKVVGERSSDKICTVELLRWDLSGGSSARVYISRERIRPVASPKKSKRRRRNRGKLFAAAHRATENLRPSMRSREVRLLAFNSASHVEVADYGAHFPPEHDAPDSGHLARVVEALGAVAR